MIRILCLMVLLVGVAGLGIGGPEAEGPLAASASSLQDPPAPAAQDEGLAEKTADREVIFAANAFPPVLPDTERHQQAWLRNDCMRCHETGVEQAPEVRHAGMPPILLTAKCRSCHVLIPGTPVPPPRPANPEEERFASFAFPPMIPASGSHRDTWNRDDCMLCHEDGTKGAPILVHEGMPRLLASAKCRSCHVQVRAVEASERRPLVPEKK